jgi:hypothetical protein
MDATLIVAPNYLADVTGVAAIQISARKIKLMDALLRPIAQCSRKKGDDVAASFTDLVSLVRSRAVSA